MKSRLAVTGIGVITLLIGIVTLNVTYAIFGFAYTTFGVALYMQEKLIAVLEQHIKTQEDLIETLTNKRTYPTF